MSEHAWRVLDGEGNEQGPYSFQDLQGFYTTGNITHETMIWTEGLDEWVPAGRVEGLLPDVPQVVQLAPAPVVAAAAPVQAAPVGGINLGPQIPGLAAPPKSRAPGWLVNLNLATCLGAVFLFFLPWVELRCTNTQTDGVSSSELGLADNALILTQSGFQTITGKTTISDESAKAKESREKKSTPPAKTPDIETAGDEGDETDKSSPTSSTDSKATEEISTPTEDSLDLEGEDGNYPPAHFVVIGFCSLLLATLLGIIGFSSGGRVLLFLSQLFCLFAALAIAVQVAMGFPILPSPRYAAAMGGESARFAATMQQEMAHVDYTIWFILELILLGSSLLFMIIALASRNPSTITIPQPGQQPLTPQQPGGGIRFQ